MPMLRGAYSMPAPASVSSAGVPQSLEYGRFELTSYPSESPEEYRPGDFHPVHFGDAFKNNRYRVILKLGNG
jgi:hypothetical protein